MLRQRPKRYQLRRARPSTTCAEGIRTARGHRVGSHDAPRGLGQHQRHREGRLGLRLPFGVAMTTYGSTRCLSQLSAIVIVALDGARCVVTARSYPTACAGVAVLWRSPGERRCSSRSGGTLRDGRVVDSDGCRREHQCVARASRKVFFFPPLRVATRTVTSSGGEWASGLQCGHRNRGARSGRRVPLLRYHPSEHLVTTRLTGRGPRQRRFLLETFRRGHRGDRNLVIAALWIRLLGKKRAPSEGIPLFRATVTGGHHNSP